MAVLLTAVSLGLLGAVEVTPDFSTAVCDLPLQWRIHAAETAWLDDDCDRTPTLEVTAPDGRSCRRPAFLIDKGALAVRAVTRQPGWHRLRLLDPAGRPQWQGGVTVAAGPGPHGPIARSRLNPAYLAWADGTPYLPVGCNVAWVEGEPVGGFTRHFAHGLTHARVWLANWSLGLAGPERWTRAAAVDGVLAAARAAGVRLTLVLDNHTDVLSGATAPGPDPEARACRFLAGQGGWTQRASYALARWGSDDGVLAFEAVNELDLIPSTAAAQQAWLGEAIRHLRGRNLDHRLLTASWSGDGWTDADGRLLDLMPIHRYVSAPADGRLASLPAEEQDALAPLIALARRCTGLDRPWLLAECGFNGTNTSNPGNEADREGVLLRQMLWAGFLLGGCGNGLPWWWDTYLDRHGLWPVFSAFSRISRELDLNDPQLAPVIPDASAEVRLLGLLSPRQALLWPQRRADTWHALVVAGAAPDASGHRIRIAGVHPGGSYRLTSWNARSGEPAPPSAIVADATGALVLDLPPGRSDDLRWTLRLTPAEAK